MAQPAITLSDGTTTLNLDPDLYWSDEFEWHVIEQAVERSITGALIIDLGERQGGRPITLQPPDDNAAWMPRVTLGQLQTWESDPALTLTLSLRGTPYTVVFRRHDGAPVEAHPVEFVADPLPGAFGDWYLTTLRLMVI